MTADNDIPLWQLWIQMRAASELELFPKPQRYTQKAKGKKSIVSKARWMIENNSKDCNNII